MMTNWTCLLAIVTGLLAGFPYRMPVEEQALRNAFGQDYERYMAATRRLVPFVF